ncbi:unnamed protein product [Rhizoctonia solani]|uniref:Uncharacterized protein n=1 Tax=Rhizoctonia solani TaxID=456999 RepID=A0A8H3H992_9AGAM|nr:unnamed protein product [Rhizoctonia solani]
MSITVPELEKRMDDLTQQMHDLKTGQAESDRMMERAKQDMIERGENLARELVREHMQKYFDLLVWSISLKAKLEKEYPGFVIDPLPSSVQEDIDRAHADTEQNRAHADDPVQNPTL